ncbi:quinoprotein alcohol dehydrogenase-like superfamily [Artemisia annua]|uniref:Quinoprotein alcohol dehydrogenase-like superfamily n=1 Tax=Artemisia annua TaxID=35608 RepID=A0A2U1KVU3_ARTAN|nr:quinoprotein alcohol dehydrogenase-like superfamily [Artemisia annua]
MSKLNLGLFFSHLRVVSYVFMVVIGHKVDKFGTGDDLPYRMVVHLGGEGVICSLPKSCSKRISGQKGLWETGLSWCSAYDRAAQVIQKLLLIHYTSAPTSGKSVVLCEITKPMETKKNSMKWFMKLKLLLGKELPPPSGHQAHRSGLSVGQVYDEDIIR